MAALAFLRGNTMSTLMHIFASSDTPSVMSNLNPTIMARSKSFFGLRRGSAGGFTYSKGIFGEQITRAKAESVRNPKSKSQQAQRMLFSAVALAAKKFGYVVNHSTQGAQPLAAALADFRRMNLNRMREGTLSICADYDNADVQYYALRQYQGAGIMYRNLQISEGDLPERPRRWNENYNVFIDDSATIVTGSNKHWSDFLTEAGLIEGDWLTFVFPAPINVTEDLRTIQTVYYVRFHVKENIPSTILAQNALIATMPDVFDIDTNFPSFMNVTAGLFTVENSRGLGVRVLDFYNETDFEENVFAIIHSRTDEGGNHRSPAFVSMQYGNTRVIVNSWPIGSALLLDGGTGEWGDGSVPTYSPGGSGGIRPRPIAPSEDQPEP